MKANSMRAALVASALVLLGGLALTGCSREKLKTTSFPNVPPSVELTNAPVSADRSNPYFYAYLVNWSGNDPDGRIDHYEYAIDPQPGNVVWIKTTKNQETIFFRASQPDTVFGTSDPKATDFHVFWIKAVDDEGAESPVKDRAFYAYTVAPSVAILNPRPSVFFRAQVTPSIRIDWTGADPDGQFSQKPIKYKYKLFNLDSDIEALFAKPDLIRQREAATNWAGWDSTTADTEFVQFTNLTPEKSYLFALIGFDEAGAYSPIFSLNSNLLQFTAGFASSLGPKITIFNPYIIFSYPSGGYTTDPLREIPIEIPTGRTIPVNWLAEPSPGSKIQYFRWMVDGNITDETPRTDEENDYEHWSQKSPTMPNGVVLRAFDNGEHRFYLECGDNNGQKSLGILRMTAVTPTFEKPLLIVDDTRLEVDKLTAGCPNLYTKAWPSATELDTFLFARGNTPWRCTKNPTSGVTTPPGLFAGYSFDTLGTRQGLENPANGVRLSKIGQYKNLVWIVDDAGAQNSENLDQSTFPVTALYAMSGPGRASTLAAFVQLGGRVWLTGGGAAYASLINFDRPQNNQGQTTIFTAAQGELAPSRIMYDGAHWQSAIAVTKSGVITSRYDFTVFTGPDSTNPVTRVVTPGWSHFSRGSGTTLTSPNYSKLPPEMRWRTAATDPIPPTRPSNTTGAFYLSSYPCEYLNDGNSILEDVNPDPEIDAQRSVLDTLYTASAIVLLRRNPPTMTYYHGNDANQFVFSGFSPWGYARQDCIALVDFVLQDIWNLPRAAVNRGSITPALPAGGSTPTRVVTPAQRTVSARVPNGATRE